MKVNLQLVVVVLNAPTNFRHDIALHLWRLKFLVPTVTQTLNLLNSPSIQYNTQGKRHEMASRPPCSLSNTIFFHVILQILGSYFYPMQTL